LPYPIRLAKAILIDPRNSVTPAGEIRFINPIAYSED